MIELLLSPTKLIKMQYTEILWHFMDDEVKLMVRDEVRGREKQRRRERETLNSRRKVNEREIDDGLRKCVFFDGKRGEKRKRD